MHLPHPIAEEAFAPRELKISLVEDAASFAALRVEWGALLARSEAGCFNGWSWLYPWHQRIGSNRSLFILTARGAGQLVGLLPLCLETVRAGGRKVRRLAF